MTETEKIFLIFLKKALKFYYSTIVKIVGRNLKEKSQFKT